MDNILKSGKTRWMANAFLAATSVLLCTVGVSATERPGRRDMGRDDTKGLSAPEERAVRESHVGSLSICDRGRILAAQCAR